MTAISHTLLLLIYQVLASKQPYQERGPPPLDEKTRQRLIRHHVRRLGIAVRSARPGPCRTRGLRTAAGKT